MGLCGTRWGLSGTKRNFFENLAGRPLRLTFNLIMNKILLSSDPEIHRKCVEAVVRVEMHVCHASYRISF